MGFCWELQTLVIKSSRMANESDGTLCLLGWITSLTLIDLLKQGLVVTLRWLIPHHPAHKSLDNAWTMWFEVKSGFRMMVQIFLIETMEWSDHWSSHNRVGRKIGQQVQVDTCCMVVAGRLGRERAWKEKKAADKASICGEKIGIWRKGCSLKKIAIINVAGKCLVEWCSFMKACCTPCLPSRQRMAIKSRRKVMQITEKNKMLRFLWEVKTHL